MERTEITAQTTWTAIEEIAVATDQPVSISIRANEAGAWLPLNIEVTIGDRKTWVETEWGSIPTAVANALKHLTNA